MRVILHSEASLGFGGQERRVLRELEGLHRKRFLPAVVCRRGAKLADAARLASIQVYEMAMGSSFDPVAVLRLTRLIRRVGACLVHTHSSRDAWLMGMAGKLTGVPVVRTRHLRTSIGGPFVYTKLADKVITVSGDVRDYLVGEGVSAERIISIPTGIDLHRFDVERTDLRDYRTKWRVAETDFLVGVVAVLRQRKGHRLLIHAVARLAERHPRLKLAIVGEGPIGFKIDALVRELDLQDRVIRTGRLSDIPAVLKAFDLFVLPSQQEALGTALLEAMAMGVPVAATGVDGIPEAVGNAGLLFPLEDVDAIAACIERVMGDPGLADSLREKGLAHVREHYAQNLMLRRTESLYDELCQG